MEIFEKWGIGGSFVDHDNVSELLAWAGTPEDGLTARNKYGVWHLRLERTPDSVTFYSSADLTDKTFDTFEFRMLVLPEIPADHVLQSGLRMGDSKVYLPGKEKEPVIDFESYNTCSVTKDRQTVLVSVPLDQAQWAVFRGTVTEQGLHNFTVTHKVSHFSPRHVEFAPVTFRRGEGLLLLEEYGESNRSGMEPPRPPLPGWNSWDVYRWTVTEDEVLKNAEFIHRDPVLSKHIRRIIVDDGWQYCYGEWEPNCFFSSGMGHLAKEIRKMGMEPGLWFAPCIVEPHSRIAQKGYDMLVCSEGGQPCLTFTCMKREGFILDPTVEKSRKFLHDLFDRYCREGYSYFKLDFLRWVLWGRRYHDPAVPKSKLMQALMEPIYDGVAGRAAIMGCNYPYMTGDKYVDAVRVGSDIHAMWDNIRGNSRNSAGCFWMNGRLWYNDPDFALCRGVDTMTVKEQIRPSLVFVRPEMQYDPVYEATLADARIHELQVLLSIVIMTGGAVNLSDDLTQLNEAGIELARKVVAAERGSAAVPLDLFQSRYCSFWLQKLTHGGRFLIVNWQEEEQEFEVPDRAWEVMPETVTDFWTGKCVSRARRIVLAPHRGLLLEWKS